MFDDRELQQLLDYWLGKRGAKALPARPDIDPLDLPRLLPDIGLIDVIDGGPTFRFRLVGTRIGDFFDSEFTGLTLAEVPDAGYGRFLAMLYRQVVSERRPIYSESLLADQHDGQFLARRLCLPLAGDGRTVDMILFMLKIAFPSEAAAGLPYPPIRLLEQGSWFRVLRDL